MRLRISKSDWQRCRECAKAIGEDASTWVRIACKTYWREVMSERNSPNTTPEDIGCAKADTTVVELSEMHEPGVVRACIRKALAFCEARNPPPFKTDKVEGRDYVVAGEWM